MHATDWSMMHRWMQHSLSGQWRRMLPFERASYTPQRRRNEYTNIRRGLWTDIRVYNSITLLSILLLFLLITTTLASSSQDMMDDSTLSNPAESRHQQPQQQHLNDRSDTCSLRYQRQIDQLQKDIGYCNAVKMAVETRESAIKQQLTDVKIIIQQKQLQQSPSNVAENTQLLQQVAAQKLRIEELEQLLHENKGDSESGDMTLQSALTDALRRITEYEQRELESTTTTTTAATTTKCQERNEYLEMRLEEAVENERRIDEMSLQLHEAKLFRISTKETQQTYETQAIWYEDRIGELEQQIVQFTDEVKQLSQAVNEKDQLISDLRQTVQVQEQMVDQSLECNDELVQLQQQCDVISMECNNRTTTLQHMLDDEIKQSKHLHEDIQTERNENRHLEQKYEELTIDCKDRIITFQQMLEEEVEQTKRLTIALQTEQDRQQHQAAVTAAAKVVATPTLSSVYRYSLSQLQHINQQYQNRHTEDNEKIVHLQNELYALRYDIHHQNEIGRHRGIWDTLHIVMIQPILLWLYDPFWCCVIEPHVVQPIQTVTAPYYKVIQSYVDIYIPLWRQHMLRVWTTIQTWCHAAIGTTKFTIQFYLLPAYRSVRDSTLVLYSYTSDTVIRSYVLLQHSISSAFVAASPYIAPGTRFLRLHLNVILDQLYQHSAPIQKRVFAEVRIMRLTVNEWREHFEHWIIDMINSRGFDGTMYLNLSYSICFLVGLVFLIYLIHRRRMRYVVPEI